MDIDKLKNKRLLLAVSTGVDSMVILDMIRKLDCDIHVIYIRHHHRIRVYIESEFFTTFCNRNNLDLTTYDYYHVDGNFESVAREFRYKCFKEVYDKYDCDYLITAHHGDDLVETMLMRQLRGTDLNSVGGIREFSKCFGMNIARPLLKFSKMELREYANKHKIIYFEDETNSDISYKRNFLRHEIIPKLGEGYIKKYNSLSQELYEVSDYINDKVNKYINLYTDVYLKYTMLDKRILKYGVKNCLKILYDDNIINIYDKHLYLIIDMKIGDKIELPLGYFVFKNQNEYIFSKCLDFTYDYEYKKNLVVEFLNSKLSFIGDQVLNLSSEVVFPLRIKNADMNLYIENSNGRQKLNRVFINAKVLAHKRASWPILIDSENKVICVFGIKYSKYCLKNVKNHNNVIQYKCEFKGDDFIAQ
ncbi:MAG: tRNA lysidine(34) synthetase TilS [Bacilli bacterium]